MFFLIKKDLTEIFIFFLKKLYLIEKVDGKNRWKK